MSAEAWWRPPAKDSEIARRLRERREGPQQPPVIYVPEATVAAGQKPGEGESTEPSIPDEAAKASVPLDLSLLATSSVSPEPGSRPDADRLPEPEPMVTETDIRRKAGIVEFERAMVPLEAKADQADIAWERYLAGCRQNIMTATSSSAAVAGMASRDWIAVVGAASTSSVTVRTWTDVCSEAGTFFALYEQVKHGMCVAEDVARRASVYPGTRREIRTRHRLDWVGWDAFCR